MIVHLGLYESSWLAAFAFNTAAALLGREQRPIEIPREEQPTAEQVRAITERVRKRLGLDRLERQRGEIEFPPDPDDLLTLFEVTIVGFWRDEAANDHGGPPGAGIDRAAARLVEAARLLFWSASADHPSPLRTMTGLLARRLDAEFREPRITRELLDDDGDDPWRIARWLVYPDSRPGLRVRAFRDEIRDLYAESFESSVSHEANSWASLLGLSPPFRAEDVRAAFRLKSRAAHPDAGGSNEEFIRLRDAYEEAIAYCRSKHA